MVLQLMTSPQAQAQSGADEPVQAAASSGSPGLVDALPFAALAQALLSAGEGLQTPADAAAPPQTEGTEPGEPRQAAQGAELSAEQWLLGMLGQQQVQVQAREARASASDWNAGTAQSGRRQPQPLEQTLAGLQADGLGPALPTAVASGAAASGAVASSAVASSAAASSAAVSGAEASVAEASVAAVLAAAGSRAAANESSSATVVLDPSGSDLAGLTPAAPERSAMGGAPSGPQAPTMQHLLKLQSPEAKWGEQMLGALRDSVELQLQQRVQSASIRLDPPELGSLEILVSHESGRLQVHISAAQGDVSRLLQQTSERLRQELVAQNFLQVEVQVGSDGQSGQQRQQARALPQVDEVPRAALAEGEVTAGSGRHAAAGNDVLITV